jgi:hypothetical protein
MRTLLLLSLLLAFVWPGQNGAVSHDGSPVAVTGFQWSKKRQQVVAPDNSRPAPMAALTQADKNYERNQRVNDQAGVRHPNADTVDGRAAAIEKIVEESRSPKKTTVDGYAYQVKVRNASAKVIEVLFWEYQFIESSNPSNVARRQFLCSLKIKPDKEKEVESFSASGPGGTVSAESLGDRSGNLYQEKVLINRVEYADGSIWQRKGWSFAEVRSAIQRATATPWGSEMCRGL